jgi:hypothetical protein
MTDIFTEERQKRTRNWQGYEYGPLIWFVLIIAACALVCGVSLAGPALWQVMR